MPQILIPIVVPAIAGGLCLLVPRRVRFLRELIALAGLAWAFAAAVRLFGAGQASYAADWMTFGDLKVIFELALTRFNAFIIVFATLFGLVVGVYSMGWAGLRNDEHDGRRYYAFLLWTVGAACGAALSNSLLFLLLFWEVLTVILFVYVNLGSRKDAASEGAAKSFIMLGLSDAALFLSVAYIWVRYGTVTMDGLSIFVGDPATVAVYLLVVVGAITKAGAVPFHTWIPAAAKGAPTPVMALLPASIDKLLGIYLLARISLDIFSIGGGLSLLLMIAGAVTIVGAVLMALVQHDLKVLLSYHAVSQVGYMVLGIGTGVPIAIAGGLFHMLNNAVYKSLLFLNAGAVEKQAGTTDLEKMGGLARAMPVTFITCAVAALAISGVPPMNGFVSKWMVYTGLVEMGDSGFKAYWIFLVAALFGSALTLASFVKVLYSAFLGQRPNAMAGVREANWGMLAPMVLLAGLCVLFGVWAAFPIESFINPVVNGAVATAATGQLNLSTFGFWNPSSATGLILLGLLLGLIILSVGRLSRRRVGRVFIGGEKVTSLDAMHVPGTGFYNTIRDTAGIHGLLANAEAKVFDVYEVGGRIGNVFVQGLRSIHNGVLSSYLAWSVVGLGAVVFALLSALLRQLVSAPE
jgi:formate hydrogenlyase subunit 3/multisubunit Na+/H+ antiporter MnhD subunit